MLSLVLCILFLIINFKYNLNIFNQEMGLIVLGVVFTPLTALGFWYFLNNQKVDLLMECVACVGLYVILLCNSYLFVSNLIILLVISVYAFKYYTKKLDFFKRILLFVLGFGVLSVFWFLKLGNNEVKAFSEGESVGNSLDVKRMPLAMIVFPFNIFGIACLVNKEKLKQNIIVMIFSIFYIFISFLCYIYMPLFNNLVVVLNKLSLILWIKIFFSLFSVMGILRFNRLINRRYTKRFSILALVLILPLLFLNFKHLKAFYSEVRSNVKDLAYEAKTLDGNKIKDKQNMMKIALADKKKEMEKNTIKQDTGIRINNYIVDSNSKENDLVYSSDKFSILIDDKLFWNDLNSKLKSEEILNKIDMQVVLLRSSEVAKIEDLKANVEYIIMGNTEKDIKDEISKKYLKIIELKDIGNLAKTIDDKKELEYMMIDKNNIKISKAIDNDPIILNYKYDKNWRGYQDNKLLNKYFVLPDKMMFLPKNESKVSIKMGNDYRIWLGLIGLVGVTIIGVVVVRRRVL